MPHHDLQRWRFYPHDLKPPLKLVKRYRPFGATELGARVVTGVKDGLAVVSQDSILRIVNEEWNTIWEVGPGEQKSRMAIAQPPYFIGDYVVVARTGVLQCFHRHDGALLWEIDSVEGRDVNNGKTILFEEEDFGNGLFAIADDDSLYFGSTHGVLRRINLNTGRKLDVVSTWTKPHGGVADRIFGRLSGEFQWGKPASDFEWIPTLYDVNSGKTVGTYHHNADSSGWRGYCRVENSIYSSSGERLHCFDANAGNEHWSVDYAGDADAPYDNTMRLATNGSLIYSLRDGSFIICYDAKTGHEVWRTPKGPRRCYGDRELVVTPSHVFAVKWCEETEAWHLQLLDQATGQEVWRSDDIEVGDLADPSIVNDRLIVESWKEVLCFE